MEEQWLTFSTKDTSPGTVSGREVPTIGSGPGDETCILKQKHCEYHNWWDYLEDGTIEECNEK